jgi:hypothetical protein
VGELTVPVVIPTSTTLPDYRQTTSLEGRDYVLRFRWNTREARWYLDVADQDETPIVSGLKLVAEAPLLRLVRRDDRRPPGELWVRDREARTSAAGKLVARDPGLDELGGRCALLYFAAAELEALAGG